MEGREGLPALDIEDLRMNKDSPFLVNEDLCIVKDDPSL
jgi:hypothetical protein